jgi:MFS family permease
MVDRIFRTLKYRNYRLFFFGQTVSLIGTQVQFVAISWLTYRLTGSAAILGLVNFVSRSPTFFFAPIAGLWADRTDRHQAMIWIQSLEMVQAASLAFLALTGHVQIWHLFALGFFLGVINGFEVPIRQSFIYETVEKKEDLGNALALNTTMIQLSFLLGPVLAGTIVAWVGEGWCFLINAVSFIAVLGSLIAMRLPRRTPVSSPPKHSKAFRDGFRHAFGTIPLRYLLLLMALISLAGHPYQVLLPVFAKQVLKGGPGTLGWLGSSAGLGALAGTLYLASRKNLRGLEKSAIFAIILFGSGLIIFAFSRNLILSMALMVPVGMGSAMQITACQTLIQAMVDDEMRGRVMSFYTMAFMGTVPFGGLLYGFFADRITAPVTVLVGGLFCLAAGAFFYLRLSYYKIHARPILIRKGISVESCSGLKKAEILES